MSPTHRAERDKCLNNGACVNDKTSIIETFEQQIETGNGASEGAEKVETTDYIGNFLGAFGRWQLRTILLIYLTKIPSSWFMSCVIFTAPTPEHGEVFCQPSDHSKRWVKIAYSAKADALDQEVTIDFCNVYEDAKQHAEKFLNDSHSANKIGDIDLFEIPERDSILVPCKTFEHRRLVYNSIITPFDLYWYEAFFL